MMDSRQAHSAGAYNYGKKDDKRNEVCSTTKSRRRTTVSQWQEKSSGSAYFYVGKNSLVGIFHVNHMEY